MHNALSQRKAAIMLTDSGVMRILTEKMSYLGQRSAVLAQNVSNSSTPGYKAKDVVPFTFGDAMKEASAGIKITDVQHIVPANMAGVNAGTKRTKSYETVPSGNSVDLEQQMMEVSKANMEYQADISVMKKFMALIRMAIGK